MTKSFDLTEGISVDVDYFAPLAVGSSVFRAIYAIRETKTGRLHKFYEIWLSQEYVEDKKQLSGASKEDILEYANDFLKYRYKESGKEIPKEGGAFLTNELGESLGNPLTFSLKLSDKVKPKYVTTTIRLPEETHKWLKEYGEEKNMGLGESIRRVVSGFQAGTISNESTEVKRKIDTAGAATIK